MSDVEETSRPSSQAPETEAYEEKPTIKYTTTVALQTGLFGVLASAVQNALGAHNRGAMGVLTRSGGTIGFFAAMGGTFAFTEAAVANTRKKDDALNGAAGGCAAGFLAGLRARSLPVAVASCAVIGGAVGIYDTAGTLTGSRQAEDTPESFEERRKRFFKPKSSLADASP